MIQIPNQFNPHLSELVEIHTQLKPTHADPK